MDVRSRAVIDEVYLQARLNTQIRVKQLPNSPILRNNQELNSIEVNKVRISLSTTL